MSNYFRQSLIRTLIPLIAVSLWLGPSVAHAITFTSVRTEPSTTANGADPAAGTHANISEGNLLILTASERSGTTHANFVITSDIPGWTKIVGVDSLLGDTNARHTMAVWYVVADQDYASAAISVDNGTANNKKYILQEFSAGDVTWSFVATSTDTTGTGSTPPLSTGSTPSVDLDQYFVVGVASWRNDNVTIPSAISWTQGLSGPVQFSGAINTFTHDAATSTAVTSGATSTAVTWTGTGSEAIAAILLFAAEGSTGTTFTTPVTVTGNVDINGAVAKGAGTFAIDHPLDPKNKLLYHSFVESPEAKNLYDGIAELNEKGEATIELPAYFLALNKDFRYLATAIGEPMPDLFLKKEVKKRWFGLFGTPVFKISGGAPGGRASWQVTGIRRDPYILARPIIPEVEKGPDALFDVGEYVFDGYEK